MQYKMDYIYNQKKDQNKKKNIIKIHQLVKIEQKHYKLLKKKENHNLKVNEIN